MVRMAVGMWFKLLVLGASTLLSVVLLVSGPAAAQPTTSPYGPHTTPSTTPATTVPVTTPPSSAPSAIAFTGADIALTVTIGALAIGVGGMFVLVSRRRRPRLAVEEVGGK